MKLLAALAVIMLLAAPMIAAPANDISPGDVIVDAMIDSTPQPSSIDAEIVRQLTFTIAKQVEKPITGTILLRYPEEMDPAGSSIKTLKFDLTKNRTTSVQTQLVLPKGSAVGQITFPVEVTIEGKKYIDLNMLVMKSVAWMYVGPFEGGYTTSHDKVFPPETSSDLNSTYTILGGKKVGWTLFPHKAIAPDGQFQFHELFPGLEEVTAYAMTNIYSDREMKARLAIGSDDSIKVWQNGKLVHNHKIARGANRGEDKADITLAKGKNTFLIKLTQLNGGWCFYFDIEDMSGKRIEGLKYDITVQRGHINDPLLRLADVTRASAVITWQSDVPTKSRIIVKPAQPGRALPVYGSTPKSEMVKPLEGAKPLVFNDDAYVSNHKYTITGLKPGARYLVTVSPTVGDKANEPLSFYTAPPAGKTMYLRLKMINIIFTNATPEKDADREGSRIPVPQSEIERVKRECELTALYYWINSGMRFWLDNEYIITDKYYALDNDSLYGVGYADGEPDEKALEELVTAAGKKVSDYDGRNFITMEKRWDENAKKWTYPHSGGGTIGPEGYPGYGKSAWKGGGHNPWLYTHECNHQYDALYHYSMGPEYLFCHFQPWDDTAHQHGEHYDGIAWLMREWAGYVTREHQGWPMLEPSLWFRYFINRWGIVEFAADVDEDGIPDNAPNLPLDEVRWNSDPSKKDTDSDGLSDLMEAMACEWVDYGLDEIWAGPIKKHRSNPANPDTDGDGILDGTDPYPIYPVDDAVVSRTPELDGVVSEGEYGWSVKLDDPVYKGDYYLAWDENNFYIAGKSDAAPQEVKIYLDADNDGWFVGRDNYHLVIKPGGLRGSNMWRLSEDRTFGAAFHNCGVQDKWPFYDETVLAEGEVKFASSQADGYDFEIAIPKRAENGVQLVTGEKMGFLIAVGPVGGAERPEMFGSLTPFEPHTFFRFELATDN